LAIKRTHLSTGDKTTIEIVSVSEVHGSISLVAAGDLDSAGRRQ
jgi:hypothetical protein